MSASSGDQPQQGVQSTSTPTSDQGVPAQPVPGSSAQEPQQPVANPEAQRYAQEAALERKARQAAEAKLKAIDDAKLSAEERANQEKADAQRERDDARREVQELRLEQAVERASNKLGIIDPDAAVKLLDWSQVEYDDDTGRPKNVDKLLEALVKARPWLAGNAQQQSGTQARIGNTGRDTQAPGVVFKTSQFEDFDFYLKNEDAIKQAMREGRILKDN